MKKWLTLLCMTLAHSAYASGDDGDYLMLNILLSDSLPSISVVLSESCSSKTYFTLNPANVPGEPIAQFKTAQNGNLEGYCIPVQKSASVTLNTAESNCIGFGVTGALPVDALTLGKKVLLPTCGGNVAGIAFGSLYLKMNIHNFKIGKQYAKGPDADFITVSKSSDTSDEPFYGVVYQLNVSGLIDDSDSYDN